MSHKLNRHICRCISHPTYPIGAVQVLYKTAQVVIHICKRGQRQHNSFLKAKFDLVEYTSNFISIHVSIWDQALGALHVVKLTHSSAKYDLYWPMCCLISYASLLIGFVTWFIGSNQKSLHCQWMLEKVWHNPFLCLLITTAIVKRTRCSLHVLWYPGRGVYCSAKAWNVLVPLICIILW